MKKTIVSLLIAFFCIFLLSITPVFAADATFALENFREIDHPAVDFLVDFTVTDAVNLNGVNWDLVLGNENALTFVTLIPGDLGLVGESYGPGGLYSAGSGQKFTGNGIVTTLGFSEGNGGGTTIQLTNIQWSDHNSISYPTPPAPGLVTAVINYGDGSPVCDEYEGYIIVDEVEKHDACDGAATVDVYSCADNEDGFAVTPTDCDPGTKCNEVEDVDACYAPSCGDADGNDVINNEDVDDLAGFVVGNGNLVGTGYGRSDVNDDGKVSAFDYLATKLVVDDVYSFENCAAELYVLPPPEI